MAFNKKIGRGSLGKSKRTVEGGPGYVGSITLDAPIDAGEKLWLAAWIKKNDDGSQFFSIVIEQPQQQEREAPRRPTASPPARGQIEDSDIPF